MQLVFITITLLLLLYITFYPRRMDFFTVAAFSSIVYLYPAILGEFTKGGITTSISFNTYACLCLWELCLLLMTVFFDRYQFTFRNKKRKKIRSEGGVIPNVNNNIAVFCLAMVEVVLCLYAIRKYGGLISSMKKVEMLSESDKITSYLKYIALFCLVYSFTNKGKYIRVLRVMSLAFITYTFLLGHRSFAVIGLLAIAEHYLSTNRKIRLSKVLSKHKAMTIAIIAGGLFFMFVKNIYAALFAGNFDLVLSRLSNPQYYYDVFLSSEASGIIRNLQNAVNSDVSYSVADYLLSFLTLIPFIGGKVARMLGYSSFSEQLNLVFNERYNEGFGIGSTFIGEAYTAGGILWLLIVAFIVLVIFNALNRKVRMSQNGLWCTFWLVTASYFTFYIYRNSLIYMFILARANLYILLALIVLSKMRLRKKA